MARTHTVEATGKEWKGLSCLGGLLLGACTVLLVLSWQGVATLWGWAAALGAMGLVLRAAGSVGKWWYHE